MRAIDRRENMSSNADVIFIERPLLRRVWLLYLIPLLIFSFFLAMLTMLPSDAWMGSLVLALLIVICLVRIVPFHVQLATSRYTATTQHIEVERGIFERFNRRIPVAYIRDLTVTASIDQRLVGVGNITVTTSSGESITLEDIADPQTKRDIIWELVRDAARQV